MYHITICETTELSADKWVILNRIISVEQQYLKPLNYVRILNYWYYIEILGNDWLWPDKIISVEYFKLFNDMEKLNYCY